MALPIAKVVSSASKVASKKKAAAVLSKNADVSKAARLINTRQSTYVAGAVSMVAGVGLGAGSSFRGTLQDMNASFGNPMGFAADTAIQSTFTNRPNSGRNANSKASGRISLR